MTEERRSLLIYRGLPGSGKTTAAQMASVYMEDYFYTEQDIYRTFSGYYFWGNNAVEKAAMELYNLHLQATPASTIIVANVFSTNKSVLRLLYTLTGSKDPRDFDVSIYSFDHTLDPQVYADRTLHKVPVDAISRMQSAWDQEIQFSAELSRKFNLIHQETLPVPFSN